MHRVGETSENQRKTREKTKVAENQVYWLGFCAKKKDCAYTLRRRSGCMAACNVSAGNNPFGVSCCLKGKKNQRGIKGRCPLYFLLRGVFALLYSWTVFFVLLIQSQAEILNQCVYYVYYNISVYVYVHQCSGSIALCTEPDPDPDPTLFFCGFPGEKNVSSY